MVAGIRAGIKHYVPDIVVVVNMEGSVAQNWWLYLPRRCQHGLARKVKS
jgi:hypothetical protein